VRDAGELATLVRFATVSSDPARAGELRRAARWLAARLARAGLERVRVVRSARHPMVLAEHRRSPGRATVLLYAHYDVQPPGPREQWTSPPFVPTRRGNDLYGRGASDDKGQLLCHVLGVERMLRRGSLGVNVVMVLDGEEEIGSPGLASVLVPLVRCAPVDAALISDTRMLGPGRPAITVGLRGSLAVELAVTGPKRDLHSGAFGGAVHNPLQGLCEVVAGLHRPDGRIALPGLYERVRPAPREVPPRTDREILREAGARRGWGERGYNAYERTTIRPALTINGLSGGHQGPGAKAVIPQRASAKLSFRLVPDQDPDTVAQALRRHLAAVVPPTLSWTLTRQASSLPVAVDPDGPAHRAAARAVERVWGRPPTMLRSGGSIAAAELLAGRLGVPTVLLGFALPDDRAHGPDERFDVRHLDLGAATVSSFLREMESVSRDRVSAMMRLVSAGRSV
jgi:acetylornithine deacetylase/succinyl-diaminopimelate desuccinylase-like protein